MPGLGSVYWIGADVIGCGDAEEVYGTGADAIGCDGAEEVDILGYGARRRSE